MTTNTGTILVVDDDALNRILLSTNLEEAGYSVAMAEDGQQALEMLQTQAFEIVLLDLLMPKMDGFEVLERMKADSTLQHIPVIVVSASDEMESVVRCIEMGAADHLPKPFDPVLLHARVNASLAAKRLHDQEQAYLEAIKREMELGRQIQADFLPLHLPQPDGWEIATSFNPAREVAGDFYDAFTLSDRCVGLIIADVCGKGVGAALFMALIRSLLRSFAEQATLSANTKSSCESDALRAVPLTNDYITLHHQRRKRMFATLFFGVLNITTGTMTYINAGHHPPITIGSNGIQEFPMPTDPALGLFPDIEFTPQQAQFALDDILLTYTDGVIEAFSPKGELFSEKRLMDSLQQNAPTASALLKRVETSVQAHVAGSTPSDDITMLAVRRVSTN